MVTIHYVAAFFLTDVVEHWADKMKDPSNQIILYPFPFVFFNESKRKKFFPTLITQTHVL